MKANIKIFYLRIDVIKADFWLACRHTQQQLAPEWVYGPQVEYRRKEGRRRIKRRESEQLGFSSESCRAGALCHGSELGVVWYKSEVGVI